MTNGCAATRRSRSSLNRLLSRRCSISRESSRAATSFGSDVRGPRDLEVVAAQHLPVSAYDATWSTHCCPRPGAELVERRELRGPGAAGQPDRRAVLEAVLADQVQRHQVELALQRPAGLAEQVADDGRQQRRGGRRPT